MKEMYVMQRHMIWLLLCCSAASRSAAAPVILNEYNAVGSSNYLNSSEYQDNTKQDPYFANFPGMPDGRIQGNGGNWFELVVVEDHVDMRGWQLRWAEHESAYGTRDIWLGAEPVDEMGVLRYVDQGTITFSFSEIWSDLPAGSIITVSEQELIGVWTDDIDEYRNLTIEGAIDHLHVVPIDLSTDISFDPEAGDWWIHVSTLDELDANPPLVTAETNVELDGPGNFSVGKDTWQLTILDASETVVFGPAGEGIGQLRGVNGTEIGKLESDPSPRIDLETVDYNDGSSSSIGAPNVWGAGEFVQDFGPLRRQGAELRAGDADQDLAFDQQDLVLVQIAGKYKSGQPATWGEGDWNGAPGGGLGRPPIGDGQFDQQDIVAALQANVYLTGPYAGIMPAGQSHDVPVPEPATIWLLVFGLSGWLMMFTAGRFVGRRPK